MPTEKKGADYIVFHLNKYVVSCEEISQGNNNVYSIGQRFTFFSLRTSRLEARTGRRQPKTATFTRCTSTSIRSSLTSTKSSPTSSLPLSVMQYQCAQTNLISSVFSLYQSFPKQHRYKKRERLYSHHLAHIHTRRYSLSLFVCEIPEAGKRKITQQQMSYVGWEDCIPAQMLLLVALLLDHGLSTTHMVSDLFLSEDLHLSSWWPALSATPPLRPFTQLVLHISPTECTNATFADPLRQLRSITLNLSPKNGWKWNWSYA